jgi:lipooligosaccharide transport system permease protein
MTAAFGGGPPQRYAGPVPRTRGRPAGRVPALAFVHRNLIVTFRTWRTLVAGIVEPVLYLFSIGVGVGRMVGDPDFATAGYTTYVGSALLATAVMNAAVSESTYGAFSRRADQHVYDAVIMTPLSPRDLALAEILWACVRGTLSGCGFLAVMAACGLVRSPSALLVVPASVLIALAFGALGLMVSTFLNTWQHYQLIQLVMLPMFLFSTTFYPVAVYAEPLRPVVQALPLYSGIELTRGLTLGSVGPHALYAAAYLAVLGGAAGAVAARRLARLTAG